MRKLLEEEKVEWERLQDRMKANKERENFEKTIQLLGKISDLLNENVSVEPWGEKENTWKVIRNNRSIVFDVGFNNEAQWKIGEKINQNLWVSGGSYQKVGPQTLEEWKMFVEVLEKTQNVNLNSIIVNEDITNEYNEIKIARRQLAENIKTRKAIDVKKWWEKIEMWNEIIDVSCLPKLRKTDKWELWGQTYQFVRKSKTNKTYWLKIDDREKEIEVAQWRIDEWIVEIVGVNE